MTDCLIIGFNDYDLEKFIEMVVAMGKQSGAYRDLSLAFIEHENKPYRALDVLTHFYFKGKAGEQKPFHNMDFLWPTITYLGSYLRRKNLTFDYVNLFHAEKDKLKQKLESNEVLSVAITTTLYVSPQPIVEIISFVRKHGPQAKIIVGGPYIRNQTADTPVEEVQNFYHVLGADIYVDSNEGEFALGKILQALKEGTSLQGIPNVAYRDAGKYVINPHATEANPLEENPIQYDIFPRADLGEFVSLRTAKSCPFSCAFCGFPKRAGKYQYLPVSLVEKELNELRDNTAAETITFLDDTFNVPKERFKDILRMMIRNNYGFRWNSFFRSDHSDEEAIDLMGKAGCEGVFLGMESGSDTILAKMNKTARTKDYRRIIPLLRKAGIHSHASLVMGFPGETYETFCETYNFIEEVQPDTFRAQLWYADPVTPVWNRKEELGITGSAFHWSHNTMDWRMASDLVEKMFLSVQNSVWLPQNGFEMWSLFYLRRKGMTARQVMVFLRSFNAAIKDKLIRPDRRQPEPVLLHNLEKTCRYDAPDYSEVSPPEAYSAERYVAAEEFWVRQFGPGTKATTAELLGEEDREEKGINRASFHVEQSQLEVLDAYCGSAPAECILAAFCVLLLRISGRKDWGMLCNGPGPTGEDIIFPVRLQPEWEMSFASFVKTTRRQLTESLTHGFYGLHILTNPCRMAQHGAEAFNLNIACRYFPTRRAFEHETSPIRAESVSPAAPELKLQLQAYPDGTHLVFQLSADASWFRKEVLEEWAGLLKEVIREASEQPEVSINAIVADRQQAAERPKLQETDNKEVFNFDSL